MPPGCPPAPLPPGQCLCAEFHRGSWTRYPLGAWPGPCAPKDLLGSESLSVTGGATARLALSGKQSPHFATGKRSGLSEPRLLGEGRPFPPRPGLPTGILLAGRAPAGQPASAPGPSGPSPSGARCLCSASRGLTAALALCLPADVSRCVAERKYTQEQARKELQQVFVPECSDDGTYSQVCNPGRGGGPLTGQGSSFLSHSGSSRGGRCHKQGESFPGARAPVTAMPSPLTAGRRTARLPLGRLTAEPPTPIRC